MLLIWATLWIYSYVSHLAWGRPWEWRETIDPEGIRCYAGEDVPNKI